MAGDEGGVADRVDSARRLGPVRTCVGCRKRAAKADLIRIVAAPGGYALDLAGRAPGRGAYLHPRSACLDLAERRRALPRALRLPGPLDLRVVRRQIEDAPPARPHDRLSKVPSDPQVDGPDAKVGRDGDEQAMSER